MGPTIFEPHYWSVVLTKLVQYLLLNFIIHWMIQQSLGSFCCLRSDWVSSQFFSEHKIQQQIINFNKFFIKPEEVEIMFENEGKNHKQSSFLLLVLCRTQDSSALCKIISDGRIQSCLMFSYRHTVIQSKNKNKLNWEFSIPKNSNLQIVILLSRWSWPGNP